MYILWIILAILAIPIVICLFLKRPRKEYISTINDFAQTSKSMIDDEIVSPFQKSPLEIKAILLVPIAFLLTLCGIAIFILLLVIIAPTGCIFKNYEKASPKYLGQPIVKKEPKFVFKRDVIRYRVALNELTFDPASEEVVYYNPSSNRLYDEIIRDNLEKITEAFSSRGKRFIYLPGFNASLTQDTFIEQVEYERPGCLAKGQPTNVEFSYSDIKKAYHIPDDVSEPCLIRCVTTDLELQIKRMQSEIDATEAGLGSPFLSFSIHILESDDADSFMSEIETYFSILYRGPLYNLRPTTDNGKKKTADDRFEEETLRISQEIRDRVDQLRARGLTSFAISKLIGDVEDDPSRLVIDRHNKILLPDYNKEIKLSPIHKAVFFLFLNHPEGIYFKDLDNYRGELGDIYKSITGRDNVEGIEDSIDKLTNPLDNSINEKCARIKNAFVSEFREELAQWYFIDGRKGEKKTIKLPRDLVTWEIKD